MARIPFVIGIAGAVGSGKSWFAEKLKNALSVPVCIFTLDAYSKDASFVNGLEYHYDNPMAIDYDKAYDDFSKLKQGRPVKLPVYDYAIHGVVSEMKYNSPIVIIIEGLYAFYDKRFLEAMDFKLWIEADEKTCMERRIQRDVTERGETLEESLSRHEKDSVPAFIKYYCKEKFLSDCMYYNDKLNNNHRLIELIRGYIYGKKWSQKSNKQ